MENFIFCAVKLVAIEDISKEILVLYTSKTTQRKDVVTKIFKTTANFLQAHFNIIKTSSFPEQLKYC